jgi:glycolate oxidase
VPEAALVRPPLAIEGEVLTDPLTIAAYRHDMSRYALTPRMVVIPEHEADVGAVVAYAAREGIPVTPRGAGSNQSGSAVGEGIILLFSRMHAILGRDGRRVRVQPGAVWDALNADALSRGLRIPYNPSSRAFCTIGGNVATGASGIHGLRYGGVDRALRGVRFVGTAHGTVDTRESLPHALAAGITDIRDRIREDDELGAVIIRRRALKSSSGYNLAAFFDHDDPAAILAHLFTGSVGTLGVITAVDLELVPVAAQTLLYLLFFPSVADAAGAVPSLLALQPSAIELMDRFGVALLQREPGVAAPARARAVLMVEFENGTEMPRSSAFGAIGVMKVEDVPARGRIWAVREAMLTAIRREKETADARFLSFADDLAVPPDEVPAFLADMARVLDDEGVDAVIYGHIGEGNLHIRPLIRRDDWEEQLPRLAERAFAAALARGGTLAGEHGTGRNRSKYLRAEWGDAACGYFREIKDLLDPQDLLNPGVIFGAGEITEHLSF